MRQSTLWPGPGRGDTDGQLYGPRIFGEQNLPHRTLPGQDDRRITDIGGDSSWQPIRS
jgi:hypothetical protein